MTTPTVPVMVRMERRALANRWVDHQWHVAGLSPPGTQAGPAGERVFGPFDISLFPDEAEGYFLNTSSGDPRAFVMWRLGDGGMEGEPDVRSVTLSYNEAARLMDAQERVDTVPLPAELRGWLEGYVVQNYKPEPKKKRIKASFVAARNKDKL